MGELLNEFGIRTSSGECETDTERALDCAGAEPNRPQRDGGKLSLRERVYLGDRIHGIGLGVQSHGVVKRI